MQKAVPVHELSIVETLIEQVESEVRRSGHDGDIVGLDLAIGRLSGINVDSIRFAFELLSPDTLLRRADLRIIEPKAACRCEQCGARTEIDDLVAECPACGGRRITFEGGQELSLESIELED
ncbi:MAG TPA: hydrogenase maturation nickel metallochaperone HypA [Planctomycetaceae bacterium]|nr:hydrogenase maturation nickel metallochaperone HypA [Planctomycetaceae bacterium]